MKPATLEILRCPSCRADYELRVHEEAAGEVMSGFLRCRRCAVVVPILQGFPFFTEPLLHEGQATVDNLAALAARLLGTPQDYLLYRRRKLERGGVEIYAAFQPFNESTRALEPILPLFRAHLKPGDYILDPWCRSGWSAEWLAKLFPEQRIVALWQGDSSVLGYRGFAHWLAAGRRSPNVEVMFVHPERGLPFGAGVFGGVYALDAFHRFSLVPFAGECLRVARSDAAIALAHMHLTNSEPDPYFERGGVMWHGTDYRAWLDRLLADDVRQGWVFSEADLFAAGDSLPKEAPDTPHYNGFVLMADPRRLAAPAATAPPQESRMLVNPLFRIQFARSSARVDPSLYDGAVGHLLLRHPIYQQRLPAGPVPLEAEALLLLALALTGRSTTEAAASLGRTPAELDEVIAALEAQELLRRTPASPAAVELQRFHANQMGLVGPCKALEALLNGLRGQERPSFRTPDGGEVSGDEAYAALGMLADFLRAKGLAPGGRLAVPDARHPLAVLLVLAGLAQGLEVTLMAGPAVGAHDAPPDLVVHDDATPNPWPSSPACPLGLGAEAGDSLVEFISNDREPPPWAVVPRGRVILALDGRQVGLDAATLAEAAFALQTATPPQPFVVASLADPRALLTVLVALAMGEPTMVETGDRA